MNIEHGPCGIYFIILLSKQKTPNTTNDIMNHFGEGEIFIAVLVDTIKAFRIVDHNSPYTLE